MTAPAGQRHRYRIILRGECQHLLTGAGDELRIETGRGWTCVMASVRDESELYGLLERFQEFALHMVSLSELGTCPEAGGTDTSGLDARADALVRLAALVATDEPQVSCDQAIETALDRGATLDEITGVLVALRPTTAAARANAAGPGILGAVDRVATD